MLDEAVFIIRQAVGRRHHVVNLGRKDRCFFVLFNLGRSLEGGDGGGEAWEAGAGGGAGGGAAARLVDGCLPDGFLFLPFLGAGPNSLSFALAFKGSCSTINPEWRDLRHSL